MTSLSKKTYFKPDTAELENLSKFRFSEHHKERSAHSMNFKGVDQRVYHVGAFRRIYR